VRCAIYTRKSSAEGLSAEFTSLDAQRSYCEAYIASQGAEGWRAIETLYDDGGYSGGTLKRPALVRLMEDIEARRIDIVVVYKIDRLSRSLKDFLGLVALFDERNVTFVSVTQAFNTTSSMGRLTLNVLLSFAQFEREVTSERLKDWFAAAKKRGQWPNARPFGYAKIGNNRLEPHPVEADIIRRIFRRYIKRKSSIQVALELRADGIVGRDGRRWSRDMVMGVIRHRVYRGEINLDGKSIIGALKPIVSERLWQRANAACREVTVVRKGSRFNAMLAGLLFDSDGIRMYHHTASADSLRYRYYVPGRRARARDPLAAMTMRFRAAELERAVMNVVDRMIGPQETEARSSDEARSYVRRHVVRVEVDETGLSVRFRAGAVVRGKDAGRLPRVHPGWGRPALNPRR
jgi:site-specific DNA recombinase